MESQRKRTLILPNKMSSASSEESDLDEKVSFCKPADRSGSHDETGKLKIKYQTAI